MTKQDLNWTMERSYKLLADAVAHPLRDSKDFQKLYDVIANEIKDLSEIMPVLRREYEEFRSRFYFEDSKAGDLLRDIESMDRLRNSLEYVLRSRIAEPKSLNELTLPRILVMQILKEDYVPLLSYGFASKLNVDGDKINNDLDLLRHYIPFFGGDKARDTYQILFGADMPKQVSNDMLFIRQTEILEGNEQSSLSRSERLQFAADGFDRNSIKRFMLAMQKAYLTESNEVYRDVLQKHFDELAAYPAIAKHLELI